MHLRDVKGISGVPCLWTSVVPHTYVRQLLHLRTCHSGGSLNFQSWIPHRIFWLVQFWVLIISLAVYFLFCRFFCTSGVSCCSSVSCLFSLLVNNLLKIVALQRRLRKIWNQLLSASFGFIYMYDGLNGIHLWWHCPFKKQIILVIFRLSHY
jgi:hypothetical protein